MSRSGITPIIAVVLLILIMVALIGFVMVFFTGSIETVTEAGEEGVEHQATQLGKNFKIDGASGNNIYLRNTGTGVIDPEEVSVFVNEELVPFDLSEIEKDRSGTIILDSTTLEEGDVVKVTLGFIEQEYSIKTTKKCQDADECVEKVCRIVDCTDGLCVWSLMINQEHLGKCDSAGNGCTFSSCWCNENGECVEKPPVDVGDGSDIFDPLVDINYFAVFMSYDSGSTSITVDDATDFEDDDEIMIIQMRADGVLASTGEYEFKRISQKDGNVLTLNGPLTREYITSGSAYKAQVVTVPNYGNVDVASGDTITTQAWDEDKGGILVFRSSGTVRVLSGGKIDMTGKGYLGGDSQAVKRREGKQGASEINPKNNAESRSPNTNIGGGGGGYENRDSDCYSCGGAGGGYGTVGYAGGSRAGACNGGIAGNALPDLVTLIKEKIFFGGGGGSGGACPRPDDHTIPSGYGGQGGGMIMIFANEIMVSGEITVSGGEGEGLSGTFPDRRDIAAGGGGAGGSILLMANSIVLGTNNIKALGGVGGFMNTGSGYGQNGGAGGKGRIEIHSDDITGNTDPVAVEVPFS